MVIKARQMTKVEQQMTKEEKEVEVLAKVAVVVKESEEAGE